MGSILGGRLSDRTVRNYIKKRNGTRLPQDRLNSGLGTLFFVLPAAALVYGWTLQEEKGGMVVPIIAAFFGGVGLMGTFNGLNTYAAGKPSIPFITVLCLLWRVEGWFGSANDDDVCWVGLNRSTPPSPIRSHQREIYHPVFVFGGE